LSLRMRGVVSFFIKIDMGVIQDEKFFYFRSEFGPHLSRTGLVTIRDTLIPFSAKLRNIFGCRGWIKGKMPFTNSDSVIFFHKFLMRRKHISLIKGSGKGAAFLSPILFKR